MKKLEILAYIAVAIGFILDYSNYGTITGRSFIVPLVIMIYMVIDCAVDTVVSAKEDE